MGKVNATIPGSIEPSSLTLDQALSLIAARAEKMAMDGGKKPKRAAKKTAKKSEVAPGLSEDSTKAPKPAKKKAAVKKAPAAKKAVAKKPVTKKSAAE